MNLKGAFSASVFPVILIFAFASISESAEFTFDSSIIVSEEYTDNIFLDDIDGEEEYITRIRPAVAFEYKSPLWQWNLDYTLDHRYYAKGTVEDDTTHIIDGKTNIAIIRDFFFLKVEDEFRRVSLDVTRDFTKESLFVNQSDRNIFETSPYFLFALSPTIKMTTGYIYKNIWFEEGAGIDRVDNIAFIYSDIELSPNVILNTGYRFTQERSDAVDFIKNDVYVGARYEYAEESKLSFRVLYSHIDFEEEGTYTPIFWNAGISHKFDTVLISLDTARDYTANPSGDPVKKDTHRLAVNHTLNRSEQNISVSLSEFRDAVTNDLETRKYGISAYLRHELTPKITGSLDFSYDKFERKLRNTFTKRYLGTVRFDYELYEDFYLAVEYKYADSHSPGIPEDNYINNRAIIEIKKRFYRSI